MIDSRPTDTFQPGDVLNNTYRVEAMLGRGGTSEVYKARSEISGRLAALKVLKAEFSANDDYLVLLTREEEIREIRHDAVVRYSENHRTQDGLVYLVMDYVDGPGLDRKLREGPMSAEDLLTVCRRVAEGLEAAHKRKIVHRDLSPDNIILRNGDPAEAVIIDFGIAKDTNPGAQTIVGNEFAGKYAYAAPEQLSGQTDARSDIYSLGAMLLANFRGTSPDVGKNPMEVVRKKSEPLDTSGVPEPLRTLIDRMAAPDPDARFQTATEVLAFLRENRANADPDATVIFPPPRADDPAPEPGPPSVAPSPSPPASEPPPAHRETRRSRGGLVGLVVAAALLVGGIGGYVGGLFDGFLGPQYPVADPYELIVDHPADERPRATGNVPSEQMLAALDEWMAGLSGTTDLRLATGDIAESWGNDVMATLSDLRDLDEWRLVLDGNNAQISGSTTDTALHARLSRTFGDGLPGALSGRADIELVPLFLPTGEVTAVLERLADCGPIATPGATPVGYGPQSPITVTGKVAETATRIGLFDALSAIAGERDVAVDVDVLNPTLCLIESNLPKAPEGGIGIDFIVGGRNEPNPSGRFFVGENPIIDIALPADVTDGYLTVSILDVSGNVYHLLPNLNRQENAVAALRDGQTGPIKVRVAYSVEEAARENRIGFTVDDSSLGKSKVIVLHSSEPLFDGLRPTSESASGYAAALRDHVEANQASILSLDSRILTTATP